MPEKLKRILQNKNWRSWKKSDWLLLALAGILLLVIALPVESGDGTAEKAYNTAQGEKETSGGSGRTASGDSGGTASGSKTSEEGEQEYVQYLEKKLENILMQMDGVGRVDVMITVSDGGSHNCRMTDLHCKLNRYLDKATGVSYSNKDLHPLFHGSLDVSLPANDDGGDYTYVMPLTKDTNVFRVVLQHLSGQDINVDDFTFSIEDRNGWIAHDNTLKEDVPLVYRAWSTYSGEAGVDIATGKESRVTTIVKVAVAELTVSRLVLRDWSLYSRPMLIIRTTEGKLVASIPIIDYALLVKGNYNRKMSDQEYLDRQDEYNMTFFLDEQNQWINSVILINSWRVVLSNVDVD